MFVIAAHSPTDDRGRYLHWDKLRHYFSPTGKTSEEWWLSIKTARNALYKTLPFKDKKGASFKFATTDTILNSLHWLDKFSAGNITTDTSLSGILSSSNEQRSYHFKMLVDEAIFSSQMEGAATTRVAAKEMLYAGRSPKDKSEQMIYNNYNAMRFILDHKNDPLTPSVILELHKILTLNTLDNPSSAGQYRQSDEIVVHDARDHEVLHRPPPAGNLLQLMEEYCTFANSKESSPFIHPVVRAIILHFMLAYNHPFDDGNGRTARAVFYWSVINSNYWLMEYVSISSVIKRALGQYARSFLYTETDDNDVTYFILHQLDIMKKAIDELHLYLREKSEEIHNAAVFLDSNVQLRTRLNFRQMSLLRHALKHPGRIYTITGHQTYHNVAYDSARKDLLELSDSLLLFDKMKSGKAYIFVVPQDLEKRIKDSKPHQVD